MRIRKGGEWLYVELKGRKTIKINILGHSPPVLKAELPEETFTYKEAIAYYLKLSQAIQKIQLELESKNEKQTRR